MPMPMPTPGPSRLRGRMVAAAAAGAMMTVLALAGVAGAATPAEHPQQGPTLPAPGTSYDLGVLAADVPIAYRDARVSFPNVRGSVNFDIQPSIKLTDPLVAVVKEFALKGRIEQGTAITIEQDRTSESSLRLIPGDDPKLEHTMALDFTVTISNPPPGMAPAEGSDLPLVLTTKNPAVLIGNLTQFPPQGDLYQLQDPIELVQANTTQGEAEVVATIKEFPLQIGEGLTD